MAVRLKDGEERLVGVIGDEDTVLGMLLAGVGYAASLFLQHPIILSILFHSDNSAKRKAELGANYFVVTKDKSLDQLEEAFQMVCDPPLFLFTSFAGLYYSIQ